MFKRSRTDIRYNFRGSRSSLPDYPSRNLLIAWDDWILFKDGLAECVGAVGYPAGALPVRRRTANGFDCVPGPHHPSSRTARANCNRLEREVAGLAARQTSAERAKWAQG
jgi:hypothetical protein